MKIVKVGRNPGNDVIINDDLVSRTHCQIIQEDNGSYRLIDVNSSNGTYINGVRRHGEVRLNPSDIVKVGNTVLPWQNYFNNMPNTGGMTHIAGSVSGSSSGYQPGKPSSYLAWAILSTIFCCLPFGIVSIVYASKVDNLWTAGRYEEAERAAANAKLWFWLSVGCSLVAGVVYGLSVLILGLL